MAEVGGYTIDKQSEAAATAAAAAVGGEVDAVVGTAAADVRPTLRGSEESTPPARFVSWDVTQPLDD